MLPSRGTILILPLRKGFLDIICNTSSTVEHSGIVILRYDSSLTISNPGGGLTFSTATVGSDKVTQFTQGTGTIQFG